MIICQCLKLLFLCYRVGYAEDVIIVFAFVIAEKSLFLSFRELVLYILLLFDFSLNGNFNFSYLGQVYI